MQKLSAADVAAVQARSNECTHTTIPFEPWGYEVTLKRLSAGNVLKISKQYGQQEEGDDQIVIDDDSEADFLAAVLSKSIVDEDNVRLFDSVDGFEFLRSQPVTILPLAEAAFKLSGLDVKKKDGPEKN